MRLPIVVVIFFAFVVLVNGITVKDRRGRLVVGEVQISSEKSEYYSADGTKLGMSHRVPSGYEYYDAAGILKGRAIQRQNFMEYILADGTMVGKAEVLNDFVKYYDKFGRYTGFTQSSNGRIFIKLNNEQVVGVIEASGRILRPLPLVQADSLWGLGNPELQAAGIEIAPMERVEKPKPIEEQSPKLENLIAVVEEVRVGSTAEMYGINVGDVLVSVNQWLTFDADLTSDSAFERSVNDVMQQVKDTEKNIVIYRMASGNRGEFVNITLPSGKIGILLEYVTISDENYNLLRQEFQGVKNGQ